MKNDKEKLEKLFNLLKDGMDMLTNDGDGLHIGVSAIIRNGDDSFIISSTFSLASILEICSFPVSSILLNVLLVLCIKSS